ncbi:peptide ABC transporter substrate-binding protein [Streptomyces sp. SAT1]|uniref:M55 family metallopeptidase n=1 Tax=unclassified Streptomyces TaxID=2593676 RepID=UPI0007DDF765|nr:M55 family metallopeptidase [Streptomyces sp. SAT1]ANH89920.1 peptide ABC transporter substrate-binding protein [Streptomyces sp. SAT1]
MTLVLISADMEGATGTVLPADVTAGTARHERFRRLLTGDVNAAVAGFADAGADEIVVNDAHCGMDNILIEELDPRATLIVGRHKPLGMMEGLGADVDAVAFVGYHTGAGEDGVLAHTYLSHSVLAVRVDGEAADEGRLNALVAAEAGVPVVLVTGDDLTCAAARRYAPGCRTVTVKTAISRHAARCRTPAATGADIRATASAALAEAPPPPAARPAPHVVEVDVDSPYLTERARALAGVTAAGPRTLRFEAADAAEALRRFRALTWVLGGGREADWT